MTAWTIDARNDVMTYFAKKKGLCIRWGKVYSDAVRKTQNVAQD